MEAPVHVESSIDSEEASARWLLKGISRFSTRKGDFLLSGELLQVLGVKFGLKLYWGGMDHADADPASCSLFAYQVEEDEVPKTLRWNARLSTVSQGGTANNHTGYTGVVAVNDYGFCRYQKRSAILGPDFSSEDTLVLELRVEAWLQCVQTRIVRRSAAPSADLLQRLSEDFRSLWRQGEGEGTDVALKVENGSGESVLFHAHRLVLCARSPVFARMLCNSGMQETKPDAEVRLSDVEPAVAAWFLEFIYTGKINDEAWRDEEALCHIFAVAHKYEVASLVEVCEAEIAARLSEDTVAERLMMADLLGVRSLREASLDFMCSTRERLASVQDTEAFKRLGETRPKLLMDIMAHVVPPSKKRPRPD